MKLMRVTIESAEAEARGAPWPEELSPANVAAWVHANCSWPVQAQPILKAMIDAHVVPVARQVKSLKESLYV